MKRSGPGEMWWALEPVSGGIAIETSGFEEGSEKSPTHVLIMLHDNLLEMASSSSK